jgi:SAM-dependent methyltransferase
MMGTSRLDSPPQLQEAAHAYDRWFETRWGRYVFGVEWRAIAGNLGRLRGTRVLDVGCGTGRFTERLEMEGAHVVGVDRDPGMLEVARLRVRGPLLETDAQQLPLYADAFDLTLAITVLEFVPEPELVLAEMARVTRRGGRLVVGILNPSSPWGLAHRRRRAEPPWTSARFLPRAWLLAQGSRLGKARLQAALWAPGNLPGLTTIGPVLESVGTAFPIWGAFNVLTVEVRR